MQTDTAATRPEIAAEARNSPKPRETLARYLKSLEADTSRPPDTSRNRKIPRERSSGEAGRWGSGEAISESAREKRTCEKWKVKNVIMLVTDGMKNGNLNWGLVLLMLEDEIVDMKILMERKTIVDGMNCQIRNPRRRLLTTMYGGGGLEADIDVCFAFGVLA